MSDFSAAYHLKTENQQDVIDLLQEAKLEGYVFLPLNGWSTFVANADEFRPVPAVTNYNKGLLLHFYRTNDFLGWGFHIYRNQDLVGHYAIISNDGENLSITNTTDESSLALIVDSTQLEALQKLLDPVDIDTAYKHGDYEFAQLVGLEHIEWVSYSRVKRLTDQYDVLHID